MKTPKILRPIRLHTTLPEDIRAVLDLHLYSEVEQRIPFGAYQKFIIERTKEFFAEKRTYLAESECKVVWQLVSDALENYPQESWVKDFPNGEEAYLTAKSLLEKLK